MYGDLIYSINNNSSNSNFKCNMIKDLKLLLDNNTPHLNSNNFSKPQYSKIYHSNSTNNNKWTFKVQTNNKFIKLQKNKINKVLLNPNLVEEDITKCKGHLSSLNNNNQHNKSNFNNKPSNLFNNNKDNNQTCNFFKFLKWCATLAGCIEA